MSNQKRNDQFGTLVLTVKENQIVTIGDTKVSWRKDPMNKSQVRLVIYASKFFRISRQPIEGKDENEDNRFNK